MSKRKRFGISPELNQAFSDAVNTVENHTVDSEGRFTVVSLKRVERDPENPRELMITEEDLSPHGLQTSDPDRAQKQTELEELQRMADTIKEQGVLQPIVVFKHLDKYRIIAGERRFLSSILAGKTDIHAKIYDTKPSALNIRLLQWIENNARLGLSLKDRLRNIQQVVDEYKLVNPAQKITATKLSELIGVSNTQARRYFTLMNAQTEIKNAIERGDITILKTGEFIARVEKAEDRRALVALTKKTQDMDMLKQMLSELKARKTFVSSQPKKKGRELTRVNLGHTKNPDVVQSLVSAMLAHDSFQDLSDQFSQVNWGCLEECNKAFRKLISILEIRLT
jgi:ParB family transcriptional regulator, chromosome partitioning protein